LAVVFTYTDTLGVWRADEVVALVGVYILVGGVIGVVIQPSMEALIEGVHDGSLDFTLTMPEDAQLLASIEDVDIWEVLNSAGIGVLAWRSSGWARTSDWRRRPLSQRCFSPGPPSSMRSG
jgi:ABC-2 type transport system permease protein